MTETITRPDCVSSSCPDLGIYVACLASYNAGNLIGVWIDLTDITDADEISEAIQWMLQQSPAPGAEEYAVHDSSGLPGFLRSTEWPDLAQLAQYAETLAEVGESDAEPYRMACDNAGQILSEDDFKETYRGCHNSGADYAEDFYNEQLSVAEQGPLINYVDWEMVWRDFTFDGFSEESASDGGVHIFRSC